jgi:hypothetical protein
MHQGSFMMAKQVESQYPATLRLGYLKNVRLVAHPVWINTEVII